MIQFRKNEEAESKAAYLLYINGIFIANAHVHRMNSDCSVTTNDYYSSIQLATQSISEFPVPVSDLWLYDYPDDIRHLDKRAGVFVWQHHPERELTKQFAIQITLGGTVLSEWRSGYTFAEYAVEFCTLLKRSEEVEEINL